ncbi:MAG: cupin domain-containing protein [Gammaproteobacteria bacterium]
MKITNLFKKIPEDLPEELNEVLASSESVRIERIVSYGHRSPKELYYDQDQNEFVLLLKGKAELEFSDQDKSVSLNEGDSVLIKAHQKHRVSWTDPDTETIWLAIFY